MPDPASPDHLAQSLFDRLTLAQTDRALGVRLAEIASPRARLWGHWGAAEGPSEIEMAVLPLWQALEGAQIVGEDLLWAGQKARVASGRWVLTGRHAQDGVLGRASGAAVRCRAMAELYLIEDRVVEGIVLLDTASLLAAAGVSLTDWARGRVHEVSAILPEPPQSTGPDAWSDSWAGLLQQGMAEGFANLGAQYDAGCTVDWPGGGPQHGAAEAEALWTGLREALPGAELHIAHRLGMTGSLMAPRASVRWRLTGRHSGWGRFGAPTGAEVTVVGITQVEFGPGGVRREITVFDEAAVWAQILLATGAHDG